MAAKQTIGGPCNLSAAPRVGGAETMTASDPLLPTDGSPAAGSPSAGQGLPHRILAAAPRIRKFVRRLGTGCAADVDDLVQDCLTRAIRYCHSFDPTAGNLESWLMKTAFHTFLDHRQLARRRPHELGDAAEELPAATADLAEVRDEVDFLLGQLTAIEQDVLLRFHRQRQSVAEIAAGLSMPCGTVKSHLHRARRKLALHVAQEERGVRGENGR
ncbi:MAG: sigma-70 family RNA polymerase sigma factor [Planctomycetes bacterium]|nr:sigma-70 family RNA polymerase sigma factor [Planctomycetota bacterium]